MTNKLLWLVPIIVLGLCACSKSVTFDEPYHLTSQNKRFLARLDTRLATLKESSSAISAAESGTYDVGKALAYVIENTPDAKVSVAYVSSTLDYTFNPASWFLTPGVQAEYKLTVVVDSGTRREIIEVTGRGGSHLNSFNAYQEAIERAVLSLYQKLSVLFIDAATPRS